MTREEALAVLGLSDPVEPEEVLSRFRELARVHHPDVGGLDDKMVSITAARDLLLQSSNSLALLNRETITEIVSSSLRFALASQQEVVARRDAFVGEVARTTRSATSHLRSMKSMSAAMAAVSTGLGFLTAQGLPLVEKLRPEFAHTMSLMLFVMAATAGFGYWFADSRVKRVEDHVAEVRDQLADKAFFLPFLATLLGPKGVTGSWEITELVDAVACWADPRPQPVTFRDQIKRDLKKPPEPLFKVLQDEAAVRYLVRSLGPLAVARLVVLKGLEIGALKETTVLGKSPSVTYSLEQSR